MATGNDRVASDSELKINYLCDQFMFLNRHALREGIVMKDLKNACKRSVKQAKTLSSSYFALKRLGVASTATCVFIAFICVLFRLPLFDGMMKSALGIRCFVPNNYFIWEATRPITDCNMCKGVNEVLVLPNITREEFLQYAYSYRPILVKGAASHWPAKQKFSFFFFKNMFDNIKGSYEIIEEDCQFLTFKTEFVTLKDVFSMPLSKVLNLNGESPWYVGWSTCFQPALDMMRQYYSRPHFLPEDAEHAHLDYIFMGYEQGAVMHLDYISRLMWQAQLKGRKTWRLNPPPECESMCEGFQFTVEPGDIFLLDTRQWYHDTFIEEGEFSLTVSSEYG